MNIVCFRDNANLTRIGLVEKEKVTTLLTKKSFYELSMESSNKKIPLKEILGELNSGDVVDLNKLVEEKKLCLPIDKNKTLITGVGLTHYRNRTQRCPLSNSQEGSDANEIYQLGLKNGKPKIIGKGERPEWFFKGFGEQLKCTHEILKVPKYVCGAGEEAELASLYIINHNGDPFRLGICLGNEFSDHLLEKSNCYYLAQSKLMPCSIGPEIYIGNFPSEMAGTVSIKHNNNLIWEKIFFTGEKNMIHSLENIEYHVFKHEIFCRPGSMHVLFLGADAISFSDNIQLTGGEEITIKSNLFSTELVNRIEFEAPFESVNNKSWSIAYEA